MSQHREWIELDECINDYMDESEQSDHKYWKLWHLGFRLMTELGIDFFYQIRSLKLPINSNLTVNLPSDYLQWSKVGVLNNGGEIIPLNYNEKLATYAEFSPDRLQKTTDNTLFNLFQFNTPIWYNFWNGFAFTTLYGLPSGAPFVGNFKIDSANGLILLDQNYSYDYLMLEYLASPTEGQPYFVPMQFKEAIIAGLAWYDIRSIPSKTHVNNSNVQMRRKEYYNQRRLAWARYKPFNIIEAYEWSLRNQRLSVKA